MKPFIAAVLFAIVAFPCHAQQPPFTNTTTDALVSYIAGKFFDVYSANPENASHFSIGSDDESKFKSEQIETIRFILPDGFVKTFNFSALPHRKTLSVDYLKQKRALIHYSDGSASFSDTFYCPARPITYQIIRNAG